MGHCYAKNIISFTKLRAYVFKILDWGHCSAHKKITFTKLRASVIKI